MGDILIICEQQDGEIKRYSKELAYKASELATTLGCKVDAIVFGDSAKGEASELGIYGVAKVHVVTGASSEDFNADQYLAAISGVAGALKPTYIFASATPIGREVMPRLAVQLGAGMATECIDFIPDGSELTFRRPVYAGKVWADVKITTDLKCATARPNVFPIGDTRSERAAVETVDWPSVESKVTLKERLQTEAKQVDLVEANVIVSGGRAMGNSDNYKILRELAGLLNASIGASRAAVDAGYISHDHQVGQTGKTVNPTLYIACGISGAIQHLAGMRTSKIVVAINKDPDAPIFTKADFGIVGDLFKVVPAVTEKLKKVLDR